MLYPEKYFYLIDFFLKKRDPLQGGVDGFATDFNFNMNEIDNFYFDGWEEVKEVLNVMKTDKVMTDFLRSEDKITIEGCESDILIQYKKKIENKATRSSLSIENNPNKKGLYVLYGKRRTKRAIKKCVLVAFRLLYKNYKKTVLYNDFVNGFIRSSDCDIMRGVNNDQNRIKKVQNTMASLKKILVEIDFPEKGIVNDTGEGYRLVM